MKVETSDSRSTVVQRGRNVLFVLIGVGVLMLKRHYAGPYLEAVHSYAGNIAVSFAVYFVVNHLPFRPRLKRILSVCLALAAVELFEAFDGFGIMTNVYDPIDFFANAVGVALAWTIDSHLARKSATKAIAGPHESSS
jgi:hypothetical protein